MAIFDCIGCILLLLDWFYIVTGLCLAMLSLDCSKIMDCAYMARIDKARLNCSLIVDRLRLQNCYLILNHY